MTRRGLLDDPPNVGYETLLEMRLQQHMVNAGHRGLFPDVLIRITCDQNDRGTDMPVPQVVREVETAHDRHLVVDHKAVDLAGDIPVQQGCTVAKRSNVKTVGFKQESQRSEDIG